MFKEVSFKYSEIVVQTPAYVILVARDPQKKLVCTFVCKYTCGVKTVF